MAGHAGMENCGYRDGRGNRLHYVIYHVNSTKAHHNLHCIVLYFENHNVLIILLCQSTVVGHAGMENCGYRDGRGVRLHYVIYHVNSTKVYHNLHCIVQYFENQNVLLISRCPRIIQRWQVMFC